ncbi:MAG: peptidylprolyl isomerase [Acidimicrobiia bacterium]
MTATGRWRAAPLLTLLALLGTGAWAQGFIPGNAVRVNDVEISHERFNAFYQEYRRPYGINVAGRGDHLQRLTQLRKEAMDEMIEQELVRQAAEAQGIEVSEAEIDTALAEIRESFDNPDEFNRRILSEGFTPDSYRQHVERMIAAKKYLDDIRLGVATVSDEELETYYRDNEIRLTLPEQVRVRHILLTWKPMGTTDDRAAIREQMVPVLEKARAGEDFAELAREYSDDYATAKNGGDTGLFHRGQMAPAFEAVAFALQPGQISDPVETPFGVHIIRLEERKEARLLPLDEVREQLRDHMREERMEAAVEQETERLRQEGEVEILIPLERPGKT